MNASTTVKNASKSMSSVMVMILTPCSMLELLSNATMTVCNVRKTVKRMATREKIVHRTIILAGIAVYLRVVYVLILPHYHFLVPKLRYKYTV